MLSPFSRLYVTIFRDALPRRLCLMLLPLFCLACDGVSRPDDTLGLQSSARWEWHGRLVVEPDSALTLVRMAIDTAHGGHDVGLARYDFNPASAKETSTRSRSRWIWKTCGTCDRTSHTCSVPRPRASRPTRP